MVRAIANSSGRATPALTDLSYASMEGVPVASPADSLASHNRKMASFTLTTALLTTTLAYVFVKETTLALEIGLSQTLALAGLFYLHEKLWRAPAGQSDQTQKETIIDGGGL
jgi:bifunctional enzyme CysN/CysC/sulfate adenylyltransferase subunit 1